MNVQAKTRRNSVRNALAALTVSALIAPAIAEGHQNESAAIFVYQRIGDDAYPIANTRQDQFEAHIAELQSGPYTVMSLVDIVAALKQGTPLPDRTVAITIDGGFRSAYDNAVPVLSDAGFPYTVFVSPDLIDSESPTYMAWDMLRDMADDGATIAVHGSDGASLLDRSPDVARRAIDRGRDRIREEIGTMPTLFSYPYGEWSRSHRDMVAASGFDAAFGQHSGVAYAGEDYWTLPRFPMTEAFGSVERFRLTANALKLPVSDSVPADPLITGPNPPNIGFTVSLADADIARSLGGLACFASDRGRVPLVQLDNGRVEIRLDRPFDPGRIRVNCTMPAREGRWRWHGVQLSIRPAPPAAEGDQMSTARTSDTSGM